MGQRGTKRNGKVLIKCVVSRVVMSADIPYVDEVVTCFMLRWLRRIRMYEHYQAGILVADVKITMTLGDHDSTGLRLVFLSVADVKITMTFTTSKS